MKKLFVAILALLYLGSSVGATFHFHYCMGKLTRWELVRVKNECDKCGNPKHGNHPKHNCCSDEYKAFRSGDQKIAESTVPPIPAPPRDLMPFSELRIANISSIVEFNFLSATLLRSHVGKYILNCVFLI